MLAHSIELCGLTFRIRSDDDAQFVQRAVTETEEYLANIQKATGFGDSRQALLVALLNRTMELEKMKLNHHGDSAADRNTIEWARNLTDTIREELGV